MSVIADAKFISTVNTCGEPSSLVVARRAALVEIKDDRLAFEVWECGDRRLTKVVALQYGVSQGQPARVQDCD